MHTPLIEKVEGRSADSIVLPDGRIFPPATFTLIPGEVTQEFDVDKIQQFQIIQQKKNAIDILIVINDTLRHVGPSVDTLMKEIKRRYQDMVGDQVTVTVKDVTKVKKDDRRPCSPSSIVLSYVDHKNYI
jgi:phenylacetate-coenzyme A ligase PaaK-like adenylate-forming protein